MSQPEHPPVASRPTCYGVDPASGEEGTTHEEAAMETVENAIGEVQYRCPKCGTLIQP